MKWRLKWIPKWSIRYCGNIILFRSSIGFVSVFHMRYHALFCSLRCLSKSHSETSRWFRDNSLVSCLSSLISSAISSNETIFEVVDAISIFWNDWLACGCHLMSGIYWIVFLSKNARFFNINRNLLLFTCGLSFHTFTFSSIIPASIVANNSVYNKGTPACCFAAI